MPTPARRQYLDIKAQHPDALLMYQVGDFFEFFDDDARIAAQALQLVLTSRSYGPTEQVPLAGVPLHALETYAGRLVAQGHKVAVCEQVEPPGRGLVRRQVTRVLTPGTLAEPGLLPASRDTFLAAVFFGAGRAKGAAGLAYVDASTGAFACTEWSPTEMPDALSTEVARLHPAEMLLTDSGQIPADSDLLSSLSDTISSCPTLYFDREGSYLRLCRHFGTASLTAYGCEHLSLAIRAAGAILAYLERTNPTLIHLIVSLTTYRTDACVQVDGRSWSALGVTEPARGSPNGPTLLGIVDATRTAMGARHLRRTLLQPLRDRAALEARLDAVAALQGDVALRQCLGAEFDGMPDLERLAGRVAQRRADPRDLHALAAALARVRPVRAALAGASAGLLAQTVHTLDPCSEVVRLIEEPLTEANPQDTRRRFRPGYHPGLDALVNGVADSRQWIANLEHVERDRTGIKSLRVTFNKVFGYSIEVSHARGNAQLIPPEYERRQTLVNAERYVTPALREHEARVFQAEERIEALEKALYDELLERISVHQQRLRATALALAQLDTWLALAEVAVIRGYVRPEFTDDVTLEIQAGRHPLVESALQGEAFIANDTALGFDSADQRMLLLTGPNMAGKSTYLRQVALIVLLAQIGSFVPAKRARIGLVDRIFTRVGADDDLARGVSTFMREMTETAYILRHATERSLIILDEVGRGTNSQEGLAIARAVVEYLCEQVGARTLFATHFYELAEVSAAFPCIQLAAMDVFEHDDQVVFLHRLVPGRTSHSYGVHVARMAGLPAPVTARATALLDGMGMDHHDQAGRERMIQAGNASVASVREVAVDGYSDDAASPILGAAQELIRGVATLNVAGMTPIEAINVLFALQERAASVLQASQR